MAGSMNTGFVVQASFDTTAATYTVARALEVWDMTVYCTEANAMGTVRLGDGTNNITDAVACATDAAVTRADTLDVTYSTLAVGGTLVLTPANSAAGVASIECFCDGISG